MKRQGIPKDQVYAHLLALRSSELALRRTDVTALILVAIGVAGLSLTRGWVRLGLQIYLIAVLDNPYRGKVSVTPEPLELVYQQVMMPQK